MLDLPEGTVKSHLYYARRALAESMRRDDELPGRERYKILESFDHHVSSYAEQEVEQHLSAYNKCSQFAELQRAIDDQLLELFKAPVLSADCQPKLRRSIQGYQREQWATWLPDAAYVAGAIVALYWLLRYFRFLPQFSSPAGDHSDRGLCLTVSGAKYSREVLTVGITYACTGTERDFEA